MPKVLFFYPKATTFIRRDMEMIGKEYQLRTYAFLPKKTYQLPWLYLKQFFFLLVHIWSAKGIVCEFAGHHALLPTLFAKLTGKGSFIISAGADAASFPQINYGNFRKPFLGKVCCLSYRWAKHIAPVHETLIAADYSYSDEFPQKQGIRNHCPGVKTPFTAIPYGIDPETFYPYEVERAPATFLMAAFRLDDPVIRQLKGTDIVLEAARLVPEAQFTLIGAMNPDEEVPPNVNLLPPADIKELPCIMSAHTYYMQLSISEGFPNALCEAMLCGCVPIGSGVTSIPHIIGDTGFVLEQRSAELLAERFREALAADTASLSQAARNRIKTNFNWARREKSLLDLSKVVFGV